MTSHSINFDEKPETPSNITVLLVARVSVCGQARFTMWKLYIFFFTSDTFWSSSGCFFMTVKEQTPVSWASTRPICSYYCCQETDVSSHTGKKVCLWLWSCASARYGCVWVFVCACAGCGRVGFGKYDLAFPTPGFCPWLRVKCTAMSGHTVLLHHTHTHKHRRSTREVVVHVSVHVWLWDDLGQLWLNPESWVGSGYI